MLTRKKKKAKNETTISNYYKLYHDKVWIEKNLLKNIFSSNETVNSFKFIIVVLLITSLFRAGRNSYRDTIKMRLRVILLIAISTSPNFTYFKKVKTFVMIYLYYVYI